MSSSARVSAVPADRAAQGSSSAAAACQQPRERSSQTVSAVGAVPSGGSSIRAVLCSDAVRWSDKDGSPSCCGPVVTEFQHACRGPRQIKYNTSCYCLR
jgi:hypothetical protein